MTSGKLLDMAGARRPPAGERVMTGWVFCTIGFSRRWPLLAGLISATSMYFAGVFAVKFGVCPALLLAMVGAWFVCDLTTLVRDGRAAIEKGSA